MTYSFSTQLSTINYQLIKQNPNSQGKEYLSTKDKAQYQKINNNKRNAIIKVKEKD